MNHSKALENFGAWSGLAYILLFGLGWMVLAQFFPPISPALDAASVAVIFQENRLALMFACVAMMVSTLFLMPLGAVAVLLLQKIEGRVGMLTLMMGFTMATYMVMNFYVPLTWSAAAFRPDRGAEIILLLSDLGFLQFMGGIPMFIMTWAIIAYASLVVSPRDNQIIPRWAGYFCMWTVILYIPELLIFFFKTGPFAWDGIVGFWIPAILFCGFFVASPFILVPAVKKHL